MLQINRTSMLKTYSTIGDNSDERTLSAKEKFTEKLIPLIDTLISKKHTNALISLITKLLQRPNNIISLLDNKTSKKYPVLTAMMKSLQTDQLHKVLTGKIKQSLNQIIGNLHDVLDNAPDKRQKIVEELSRLTTNLLTKNAPNDDTEEEILTQFIGEINTELSKSTTNISLITTLLETARSYPRFCINLFKHWINLSNSFKK